MRLKKLKTLFQSLRIRLLASFMLLITICMLLLSIGGGFYYSRTLDSQTLDHTTQLLEQVQLSVDAYVRNIDNMITYIMSEPDVSSYVHLNPLNYSTFAQYDYDRLILETSVRNRLHDYASMNPEVGGIIIACQNNIYTSYGFYRITHDPLSNQPWYKQALDSPHKSLLISKPIGRNLKNWQTYASHDVIMVVKAMIDPLTAEPLGVICIDLKLDSIQNILYELKLGQSGTIFILDEKGEIVYTPVNPLVYRVQPQWFSGNQNSSSPLIHQIGQTQYSFLYSTSSYTGWKTIALFPHGVPQDTVRALQRVTVLIAVLTIIFASFVANLITKSVTQPLSALQKLMLKAEHGDLDVHYTREANDEVGQLGASFDKMMNQIRSLMALVVREQREKREAELSALQAQINPHFLYNTLDTIQWMAFEHDAPEIVQVISALTTLFRISLSRGKEFILLSEELEHINSYLYIQKIRYEDKLNYSISIDSSGQSQPVTQRKVLKLLLQPLVENALYHGIKPKRGTGHISIMIFTKADTLILRIIDNGIGMESDVIDELNHSLQRHSKIKGYGSYNVNERLVLHFGEPFGLRIYQNPDGGIISEIRHPLL